MRVSLVALIIGVLLLAAPVPGTRQPMYACGPAGPAAVKMTHPAHPDQFIPSHPGSDAGTNLQSSCQLHASLFAIPGALALVIGLIGIVASRRADASVGRTRPSGRLEPSTDA